MEYFIVCVILVALIFVSREAHVRKEAKESVYQVTKQVNKEWSGKIKSYKDQMATLNQLYEKNSKMLSIKNEKILDLITQVNSKNDKIDELSKIIVSDYPQKQNGTLAKTGIPEDIGLLIENLRGNNRDAKLINNKLTFSYLLKKQENKNLSHDIKLYVLENERLEQIIKNLVLKLNSMKHKLEGVQSTINEFEKEWLYLLESSKNEINMLKRTILKKHIEISNRLSKEQLVLQTNDFVQRQLRLNEEIDKKNNELVKLKELFIKNLNLKNGELAELFTKYEQELGHENLNKSIQNNICPV